MSLQLKLGCMFSGKSTEIIRIVNTLSVIDKNILLINSKLDERYSKNCICSHDKVKIDSLSLNKLEDVPSDKYEIAEYIIIDEAQFFDDLYDFVSVAVDLNNKHVICVGLNGDSDRKNFGDIHKLIPIADDIHMLKAMCSLCKNGKPGIFSKKIVSINNDNTNIDIGSTDKYIPVCRICYNK